MDYRLERWKKKSTQRMHTSKHAEPRTGFNACRRSKVCVSTTQPTKAHATPSQKKGTSGSYTNT
jgi:hypothetical protein